MLPPRYVAYQHARDAVHATMHKHARVVERHHDDAFADLTHPRHGLSSEEAASMLRQELARNGFAARFGLAPNKLLAQVASSRAERNTLTIITAESGRSALRDIPVDQLPGVGPKTEAVLRTLGAKTGADVQRFTRAELTHHLGTHGAFIYSVANAVDHRPVHDTPPTHSISAEHNTIGSPIEDALPILSIRLASRLADRREAARTIRVRLSTNEGSVTRSWTRENPIRLPAEILASALPLLAAATSALSADCTRVHMVLEGFVSTPSVRQPNLFDPLH